jgi:N-glycosylase/DNA lyase
VSSTPSRFSNVATCGEPRPATARVVFPVRDYDLAATLNSGQVFRWAARGPGWVGVVRGQWLRLTEQPGSLVAETPTPQADWQWAADFLQIGVDLDAILTTFPPDAPMRGAVQACRGLRLLRQDPWECLASFILSSTKQIVQIRRIVATLCERYGTPVPVPAGEPAAYAFPTAERLAGLTEAELRACRMGFRAPYLRAAARAVTEGRCDLAELGRLELDAARARLLVLPGVGRKIADCVLLFAYGFPTAFPLDVWVLRALRELYFRGKRPTAARLQSFAATHFGPHAGYAQQYLFHFVRTRRPKNIFR